MVRSEFFHVLAAIILFSTVAGLSFILQKSYFLMYQVFIFVIVIIGINVLTKKFTANLLEVDIEHKIWNWRRYGLKRTAIFKKPVPAGIIFPLLIAILSGGIIKLTTFLTYETRALKAKAFKQIGPSRYAGMTDWENGFIGATGIAAVLLLALIAYFLPYQNFEYLSKLAIYYAFFNLLPISKLDGTQILIGSRVVWTILATITIIFTAFALLIP